MPGEAPASIEDLVRRRAELRHLARELGSAGAVSLSAVAVDVTHASRLLLAGKALAGPALPAEEVEAAHAALCAAFGGRGSARVVAAAFDRLFGLLSSGTVSGVEAECRSVAAMFLGAARRAALARCRDREHNGVDHA